MLKSREHLQDRWSSGLDSTYSPKARFTNDNFHHSQPLPENYSFSAIRLIWENNITWEFPTNPATCNTEKSEVIFIFILGQLCRECKHTRGCHKVRALMP